MNRVVQVLKNTYEAFLCVEKNGKTNKEFSTKKFWAFFLMLLAVCNHLELYLWPYSHWVTHLQEASVPSGVVIAMIASLDALAAWSLSVYGYAKVKGAP